MNLPKIAPVNSLKRLLADVEWNSWVILLCSMGLIFIWPLPGTIALRHVLLGVGFVASLFYLQQQPTPFFRMNTWSFWLFLSFYGWILIHLALFSREWSLQFSELAGLWMRAFLASLLGSSLGLMLAAQCRNIYLNTHAKSDKSNLDSASVSFLFIGLLGTFLIFFGRYCYEVYITDEWVHFSFFEIPYKAKVPFVIGSALLLPLCFALIFWSLKCLTSKWWIVISPLGIVLVLFGDYFANTRSGMVIFSICLAFFCIRFLLAVHWSTKKIILGSPIFIGLLLLGANGISNHIERNIAWPQLIADIQVGADISHQTWWKDISVSRPPINPTGETVDGSTYLRTAWFLAGSQLLLENPEGYGLVHHSFGSLAGSKWPDFAKPSGNVRGATHSGWLDFALGVGIPGLLLVLIPLWVSWYRSLFQKGLWFSYASWTIPIMTFAYLITEANEAHFIELLFFMTAFFCGLTLNTPSPPIRRIISRNIKD